MPALAHEQNFEASTGQLDGDTADALVAALGHATTTPDDVFVAVWEGWGGIPAQRFPGAARIDTDNRGHFLLRGPLTGVLRSVSAPDHGQPVSGLWWPADRAWFVATEIDHEWTFIAGQPSLIEQLLEDPQLEVASTAFDAPAGHAPQLGWPVRRTACAQAGQHSRGQHPDLTFEVLAATDARGSHGATTVSTTSRTWDDQMPYTDQQLIAWYEEVGGQLPRGTISFGVDSDAGTLFLALRSDHDDVAVQSLLEQLPPDAVTVRLSDEHWYGHGPRVG